MLFFNTLYDDDNDNTSNMFNAQTVLLCKKKGFILESVDGLINKYMCIAI